MLWPRPSTVSTKPRSSIGAGRGGRSTPSSSQRWNGSIGSTIAGCWSPSATSRRPRPRSTTTPRWTNQLWRRDSNETASGKPGAVHLDHIVVFGEAHLRRILAAYAVYYNKLRTHLSLGKDSPRHRPVQRLGELAVQPILGGLHHEYYRT